MKSLLQNFRSGPAMAAFGVTLVVGLALDLWTKRWAFDELAPWGIEQVDEPGPRFGALQVVPRRSMPVMSGRLLGIFVTDTPETGLTAPAGSTSPASRPAGVAVHSVEPMSFASEAMPVLEDKVAALARPDAGIRAGDRLLSINGQPVTDAKQLDAVLFAQARALNQFYQQPAATREWERATPEPPKGLDLQVERDGKPLTFRIHANESSIVHPHFADNLHFQALVNQGAVFGIGQGQRWLFLAVSVLAIGFILYLFATSGTHRFYQFVLGMLLAGVLGNMYDRLNLGFVRDMIHALPGRKWPGSEREIFPWIFNVADSWLCIGVGLIFLYTLRGSPATRDRKEKVAETKTA